ncbi:MAG TPA: phosphate ABC transporter permease PstA [Candidatus Sulfotelmatobacter sp.]|jgi:phosphate transport system permease protein|nr:phosphate ABC transporter permease PstA [Candidatus Sulfotelmatobacter sp.]
MLPSRRRSDRTGRALTWLCGGALALNLLLILGLLVLLAYNGGGTFWPKPLTLLTLADGSKVLGEIERRESIPGEGGAPSPGSRIQLKVGNRDLSGADFLWVDESKIVSRQTPGDAIVLERMEWGNFYGFPRALRKDGTVLAEGAGSVALRLGPLMAAKRLETSSLRTLERRDMADVNRRLEQLRLERRHVERADLSDADRAARLAALASDTAAWQARYDALAADLEARRRALLAETLVVEAASGQSKEIPVGALVRAIRPNEMGLWGKSAVYASRIREFLLDDPRESNTEGGIFPAIFGTVMMVLLMSAAVLPLGVLAALYLREYAKQGPLVRAVRVAVNNLAGVPSIVFGVFGLGFFVYAVGGTIDRLFYADALPAPTFGTGGILWASLTLALLTVPVVIVATEEGLAAVPRGVREGATALGATRLETIWKVVLPAAAPGILTGMILAMARAAGEVAPLMIVGMVKLAPALPIDTHPPFVHFERKFMHLGFHIYDVGFQSPNVEATKPLVFATALLLIAVVTVVNLAAIVLRNRLRRKYTTSVV